jgi:hypothetical protein
MDGHEINMEMLCNNFHYSIDLIIGNRPKNARKVVIKMTRF